MKLIQDAKFRLMIGVVTSLLAIITIVYSPSNGDGESKIEKKRSVTIDRAEDQVRVLKKM